MSKKYYFITSLLLVLTSCHKPDNRLSAFTKISYPLAVGNWWQYQLASIGSANDTFMLSVVSQTNAGVFVQYNCNYIGNGISSPAGYFLQSDTSLSYTNTSPDPYFVAFPNFHLKFPVQAGQYWAGSFPGDSILVDAVAPQYSAYGHTYGPCFYTNENYNLPHNRKVETMILTPKIGLIEQNISFNSDTAGVQIQQSILLLNYHVQ